MLDEIIGYHRWAVEGMLIVMLLNLLIPMQLRHHATRMIFWTRVGYFAFWALWSMAAFAGLIDWVFTQQALPLRVIVMIVVAFAVAVLEGYRPFAMRRLWVSGQDGVATNTRIVAAEIVLSAVMLVYGLLG